MSEEIVGVEEMVETEELVRTEEDEDNLNTFVISEVATPIDLEDDGPLCECGVQRIKDAFFNSGPVRYYNESFQETRERYGKLIPTMHPIRLTAMCECQRCFGFSLEIGEDGSKSYEECDPVVSGVNRHKRNPRNM